MKRPRILAAGVCSLISCAAPLCAQVASKQQILGGALAALAPSLPVSAVKLSGIVNYTAGSDEETAKITLIASGPRQSDISIELSAGTLHEVRSADSGTWSGADGVAHPIAVHNTWTTAAWFSPSTLLGEWISDPGIAIDSVTAENRNGVSVQHITAHRELASEMPQATHDAIAAASRMDLYLKADTLSPVALEFSLHPDGNLSQNVPVRIEYSAYQPTGAVQAPSRIREYWNGSLYLDITVGNVSINPADGQEGN